MQVLTLDQAGYFAWFHSKKNKSLFVTFSLTFLACHLTNIPRQPLPFTTVSAMMTLPKMNLPFKSIPLTLLTKPPVLVILGSHLPTK